MHGLLRRLFAPRWQHPDPEVRLKALHTLDPQHPEQRTALVTLAQDDNTEVALAALLALDDLQGLMAGYPEQADNEAWFNALCQRLTGAEGRTDLATRQTVVAQLTDPRLLNALAARATT